MRSWQLLMIYLARNSRIKNFMQNRASLSQLSKKYVGGKSISESITIMDKLKCKGIKTSLYYLGEYIDDPLVVDRTVSSINDSVQSLHESAQDILMCVDPTEIGQQNSFNSLKNNSLKIIEVLKNSSPNNVNNQTGLLMIDMEDSTVTDNTLELYHELKTSGYPVAVTLQAYLHRSKDDLNQIIEQGGIVRLVKGAFAESGRIAYTKASDIENNFLALTETMFRSKKDGISIFPMFATHDEQLINKIILLAEKYEINTHCYEFEMLYGVNRKLQDKLSEAHLPLRIYLPYGEDWWSYAVRRIGENPKNVLLLLKSFLRY